MSTLLPTAASAHAGPAHAALARVVPMLFSDGAAAVELAGSVLAMRAADAGERAIAHAVCALYDLRESTVDAALQHWQAAKALNDPGPIGPRAADLLVQVHAHWHRREGRLAEAEALMRPLHARADSRPVADAYLCAAALAVAISMRGDEHGALDLFWQALALARRSGDDALLVNALNNLGSAQCDLYNLEDAAPLLEECLSGALRLGSRRQIIFAASNLAQCLSLMGQAERALAIAREHIVDLMQPDDPPAIQRHEEVAQVLLDNGLIDEAEAALGVEAHVDTQSNEMATRRVWLTARVLLARGRADEALRLCMARQQWLDAQTETGTVAIDRVHLLRLAADAAGRSGDHRLAYQLLDRCFAKHTQLLGRASRSRQLSLQIAHRLRQAEWERDAARQTTLQLQTLNASLQAQVAETERLRLRLQAQALEDPLTGLNNRRHLMDTGAALIRSLQRRGAPLAIAMVDLDHFKQVNDRHGHAVGDHVLRAFADLARRHTRARDMLCRYGGEEFVLVFPGASTHQAANRIEQMLRDFAQLPFEGAHGEVFHSTFSAGVGGIGGGSTAAVGGDALAALLSCADAALYRAKNNGRARVHVAAPAA